MPSNEERDDSVDKTAWDAEDATRAGGDEGPVPYRGMPDHTGWFGEVVLFLFGFIALPAVDVLALTVLTVAGAPRGLAIVVCALLYAGGIALLAKFFPKAAVFGALLGAVVPLIAFSACLGW